MSASRRRTWRRLGNTWIPEFVAVRALADLRPFTSGVIDKSDYFPGIWARTSSATCCTASRGTSTRVWFSTARTCSPPRASRTGRAHGRVARGHAPHPAGAAGALGILMPTNEWEPIVMLALSNHSTLLSPTGHAGRYAAAPFAGAFNFYVDTFKDGYAPAASSAQIANLYQQFAQGDFAMYISGPWNVGEFKRRLPADMQDKWATCPFPARDAANRRASRWPAAPAWSCSKARSTKPPRASSSSSSPAPNSRCASSSSRGDLPARRSAWRVPALTNEPHFPAFREQLEHVEPLPKVPEWEQIASSIYDRGEAAARGAQPVAERPGRPRREGRRAAWREKVDAGPAALSLFLLP